MNWFRRFLNFLYRGNIPLTKSLIVIMVTVFLWWYISFLFGIVFPLHILSLERTSIPCKPWSLLTYPLLNTDPLGLIFNSLALWLFGGSLEIIWGTGKYFRELLIIVILTGIGLWLGMTIMPGYFPGGFYVINTALIVAWVVRNPGRVVLFSFIFPLEAKWLGIIVVFLQFFSFLYNPLMGLLSLSGSAYAYFTAGSRWRRKPSQSYYSREAWRQSFWQRFRRKHLKRIK